jgi:hypothetical protein
MKLTDFSFVERRVQRGTRKVTRMSWGQPDLGLTLDLTHIDHGQRNIQLEKNRDTGRSGTALQPTCLKFLGLKREASMSQLLSANSTIGGRK